MFTCAGRCILFALNQRNRQLYSCLFKKRYFSTLTMRWYTYDLRIEAVGRAFPQSKGTIRPACWAGLRRGGPREWRRGAGLAARNVFPVWMEAALLVPSPGTPIRPAGQGERDGSRGLTPSVSSWSLVHVVDSEYCWSRRRTIWTVGCCHWTVWWASGTQRRVTMKSCHRENHCPWLSLPTWRLVSYVNPIGCSRRLRSVQRNTAKVLEQLRHALAKFHRSNMKTKRLGRNPKEVYCTDNDSPEQRQETEASSNNCDRLPFLSKAHLRRLTRRERLAQERQVEWHNGGHRKQKTSTAAIGRPWVVIFSILIIMANCLTPSAESMVSELATPTTRRPPIGIDEAVIDSPRNHGVSFVPSGRGRCLLPCLYPALFRSAPLVYNNDDYNNDI